MAHEHATTPATGEHLDAWHTHSAEEGVPQTAHTESLPAFRVLGYGLVLYMAVVSIIVIVAVYYITYANSLQISSEEYPERFGGTTAGIQQKALEDRQVAFGEFTSAQSAWVDQEAGRVRLSMDAAMKKVAAQYGKK